MPNIAANKKDLRKSKRRLLRNRAVKARIKTLYKKAILLMQSEKKQEVLLEQLKLFYKVTDKAVLRGVLKKNTASRKKSGLAKKMFKLIGKPQN